MLRAKLPQKMLLDIDYLFIILFFIYYLIIYIYSEMEKITSRAFNKISGTNVDKVKFVFGPNTIS